MTNIYNLLEDGIGDLFGRKRRSLVDVKEIRKLEKQYLTKEEMKIRHETYGKYNKTLLEMRMEAKESFHNDIVVNFICLDTFLAQSKYGRYFILQNCACERDFHLYENCLLHNIFVVTFKCIIAISWLA